MQLPKGFKYYGVNCGMKSSGNDLGVIVSDTLATCAGAFTKNSCAAACVGRNRQVLQGGSAKVVVVNSKNANACTGEQGVQNNLTLAQKAQELFGGPVFTASTGIIGKQLPMEKLLSGLEKVAAGAPNNFDDFAEAIMTTDLTRKQISLTKEFDGVAVTVSGVAKGSGMIHPNMATMLAFLTTDAKVEATLLQQNLAQIVDDTFNQISVDCDTSTNDMVICLANGESGAIITEQTIGQFADMLYQVMEYLAKEIARDGEGATKLIEVNVSGAPTKAAAQKIARSIVSSQLIRCAVYGEDNNWGRTMMAIGNSGVEVDVDKIAVEWLELTSKEPKINVNLNLGDYVGKAWGCDMTEGYIKINTAYN